MEAGSSSVGNLQTRIANLEKRMDEVETQIQSEVTGEFGKQQPRPVDVNTGEQRIQQGEAPTPEVTPSDPSVQQAPTEPEAPSQSASDTGEQTPQPSSPPVSQPTPEPPSGAPPQG